MALATPASWVETPNRAVLLMGTKASPMPTLIRISAGSTWREKLVWAPIWVSQTIPSAAAANP